MIVLRCERVASGDVDGAIARLGSVTLARMPEGRFVEVTDAARAIRELAFAGVRATPAVVTLAPRAGSRAALGRDLAPLPLDALALDLVQVRAVPLGSETRRLLRHSRLSRVGAARRALCRDLLRGTDAAFGWRRRAWTTREVLRSAAVRRSLRPVVFDVTALVAPPEREGLARHGLLGVWLFA